eukprot:SAG31_NODE_29963_length_387_cov_0.885417_1_plen_100_part_01
MRTIVRGGLRSSRSGFLERRQYRGRGATLVGGTATAASAANSVTQTEFQTETDFLGFLRSDQFAANWEHHPALLRLPTDAVLTRLQRVIDATELFAPSTR